MSKETKQQPYFPHNANSRNDDRLIRLRIEHGVAGYGVYYMLLERLRLSDGYQCVLDYDVLCWDLCCEEELIRSVIYDFGLFIIVEEGQMFQSIELNAYMRIMEEKKNERAARARSAAEARWGKSIQSDSPAGRTSATSVNTSSVLPHSANDETHSRDYNPETDRLDEELEVMKKDDVWLIALAQSTKKTQEELLSFFPKFKERCVLGGIRNGHKDIVDAETHFESWLYKSGRVNCDTGKDCQKNNIIPKGKRTEYEIQQQKDLERKERAARWEKNESSKAKPDEWIRSQGYDPGKVTLLQLMQPGWREQNPPTHPEWIGQDIKESVEV